MRWMIALFFIFILNAAFSQVELEPVFVTTKSYEKTSDTSLDVEVISSEKIDKSGEQNVVELLKKMGSFDIAQSGAKGSQASFFYRGLEMRHMLVMINGVKVADPSNTDRHFDFSKLDLSDVEKIEIVKGAGSIFYGSEAIGGVINIITKKAKEDKVSIKLNSGIQNSLWLSASKVFEKSRYNIESSLSKSNYMSSARSGDEYDSYVNQNYSGFYEYNINDKVFLNFFAKIQKSQIEFDAIDFSTGAPVDNFDNEGLDLDQIYSQNTELHLSNNSKLNIKLSHHRLDRESYGDNPSLYTGKSNQAEVTWNKKMNSFDFAIGADSEKEMIESSDLKQDATLSGLFFKLCQIDEKLFWDLGLRGANHSQFSSLLVGGAGVGYHVTSDQTIRLNYSTGFKQPSLYQLYAPAFGSFLIGNENLSPERSQSVDLSYDFRLSTIQNKINFYFYQITNLIDFGSNGYENLDEARIRGIEYSGIYRNDSFQTELILNAQTFDKETPLRRAKEKANLNFSYYLGDTHQFEFQNRWVGNRYDEQNGTRSSLSAYFVNDLSYYFHFNKENRLGAHVFNLFNSQYELIKGYSVDRQNVALEYLGTF